MTAVPLSALPPGMQSATDLDVPVATRAAGSNGFGAALERALETAGDALRRADGAERAFAAHRGGLQEMVVERAHADVVLSLASAAASRTAQSVSTILGMQV